MAERRRGLELSSSGRRPARDDGFVGHTSGCAKRAAVWVSATQTVDGASNLSATNAGRPVEHRNVAFVVAHDQDEEVDNDGDGDDGGVHYDQRSTGANQRVTSTGARQLATLRGEIRCETRGEPAGLHRVDDGGERSGGIAGDTIQVGRASSTVRPHGSLKLRSRHFSASVNQFNCEPSAVGASQWNPSSERQQDGQQHSEHEQGREPEQEQPQQPPQQQQQQQQWHPEQTARRLIRHQLKKQHDATATSALTPTANNDQREIAGLNVNEPRESDRAFESVPTWSAEATQVQVAAAAAAADHFQTSASCQSCRVGTDHRQRQREQLIKLEYLDRLSGQDRDDGRNALDEPDTSQEDCDSLISITNSTFWTKLSNLSRSIVQQEWQQHQQHHQQHQSFSDSSTSAAYAPDEASRTDGDICPFLAPEVLSYLETKKKQAQPAPANSNSCPPNQAITGLEMTKTASGKTAEPRQSLSPPPPPEPAAGGGFASSGLTRDVEARLPAVRGQDEQQASRKRKKESGAQITSQLSEQDQQQQQQRLLMDQDACPSLRRSQFDASGQNVIKLVGSKQATQSTMSSSSSGKMQRAQLNQTYHQAKACDLELVERLEGHTHPTGGVKPAEPRQQQVKLSIATNATNTTTTNTSSTSTATRSSSASSLSSCILSESMSGQSDEARLRWGKKMDFLLSIIGFAVDLANIWRFPYLVYKNGGGVFLIPYLTMLIFGGIPLFFLELCLGQYVKKGPITVWNKICPYMKGVGYCSILISWYVSFYYNVLIAWSVYFIYRSISSIGHKMPWEDCDNSWNSASTCVSISQLKELCSHRTNVTLESCRKEMFSSINVTSPASEFFVKELSQIDQSAGLDDMGYLRPELVFCTIIVYLLHYFSLFRGLETSGKVVWVTATAPYMILSILLIRGLFLPGASMGIAYYLYPRIEKLRDPSVWIDAAGQVFYSIGVGFGVHLTYASFNSHDNNCYRDCLMTSAVNALTSVYSGLVVFVYLGYMATNLGIEIDKVASEGYSLVFEVYPEALTTLPFARFWSILFFIMLLTLGIDSAMGGLEAVITGLEDEFKFAKRLTRGQLTGLVIVSSFLPALISCTQGGAYTLFWFDIYSAGVSLLFSALFETIGVVYCYGLDKFIANIESMLGRRPQLFYLICWKFISPTFLMLIIFMSIYTASVPVYRGYTFPLWSVVLGWCLAFSSVAAVPIVAIYTLCAKTDTKALSATPSKSPRKLNAGGALSATSGGSKNVSRKSTPSQGHHCRKSMSAINYNDITQQSGARATSSVVNMTSDHHQQRPHPCYKEGTRIKEEML